MTNLYDLLKLDQKSFQEHFNSLMGARVKFNIPILVNNDNLFFTRELPLFDREGELFSNDLNLEYSWLCIADSNNGPYAKFKSVSNDFKFEFGIGHRMVKNSLDERYLIFSNEIEVL